MCRGGARGEKSSARHSAGWALQYAWGAALVLCACGGELEGAGSPRPIETSTCAGAITSQPVVLRADLPGGRLLVGADYLILLGSDGVVSRIDRCSGVGQVLASGINATSSTLAADYVWFSLSGSEQTGLFRVHVSGGTVEGVFTGFRLSALRAHETTVFFTSQTNLVGGTGSGWSVYALEANETTGTQLATLRPDAGGYVAFQGVSEAGLYFSMDYDCFCTPPLRRLPFGATELVSVPGAEGSSGGRGGYSVAVAGEHLYVKTAGQIARLPLTGGQPEILVSGAPGDGLVHFAANELAVCWMAYENGYEVAPRCVKPSDPDRIPSVLDRFEAGAGTSFALAPDAAYWLRPITESPLYELVAVAL